MSRSGNLTIPYTSVRTTIILLLHVEIPQNSSMIQHTVLLSYIEWMILFFDMWSLLNVYYQFMSFHSEELLEMSQCSDTSVCTAITRLKIMVSLVYREFLQPRRHIICWYLGYYTRLLSTFSGVWLLEIRQCPSTSVRTTIIPDTIHRYVTTY